MKKQKDFFQKATQEAQQEQPKNVIGTWRFIDWLCSKEEILTGENEIK